MIVRGGVGGEADGSPRSWAISSGEPPPPLFAKAVITPTDGLPPNRSRTRRRCSLEVPTAPITFIASDRQASSTLDPRFSKGGFYGKGIYLAEDPSYPIGGRYAHRSPLGREPRAAAHREGRPRLAAGDEGDAHAGRAR